MINTIYSEMLGMINELPVLDTHEHLESEPTRLKRKIDMFNTFMMHYASCDLVSAGMTEKDMDLLKGDSDDPGRKWSVFSPYWLKARNTTYCRALIYSIKDIYGIDDINDDTYIIIDSKMKEMNKKGLYRHVLKDICKIEKSILDSDINCDKEFFVSTARLDDYIVFKSKDIVTNVEKQYDISINDLTDWIRFIKKTFEEFKYKHKAICLKCGLAYERTLRFDRTSFSEADRIFSKILSSNPASYLTKPLEDYLMHVVVQTAADLDMPIQFHTGLQEGNGNILTISNPVNMINLFMDYPKARIDIFHAGYPYGGELCAMAKNFRNVYVDLCWAHIISREYTVRFIEEMLDTVPSNKLFGFGGDYCFVEGVCGHLKIARENIALALSNKIEKGYLSKGESTEIAKRLLYGNAKEFYNIS
jgi:uncharacterized protein